MSHPANEHSDLSAPSLPAPGAASTLTAAQPGFAGLPAPDGTPTAAHGPTAPTLTIDGDAPRLGSATPSGPSTATPTPEEAPTPIIDLPSLPSLPTAAPVLTAPAGIPAPDDAPGRRSERADHPTRDSATASVGTTDDGPVDAPVEPVHPMAHLMPEKAAPSEASRKAAELRAAKKAKAKKIKLAVAAGMLVFAAVVGPPLWSWLSDAIAQSGGTTTEEPAS